MVRHNKVALVGGQESGDFRTDGRGVVLGKVDEIDPKESTAEGAIFFMPQPWKPHIIISTNPISYTG